jgi:hypothetical protein
VKFSAVYNEGYRAGFHGIGQALDVNPYPRDTENWTDWRLGWASGDYAAWRAALMDKRKASTE